jgi:hypothetical protein
MGKSDDIKIRTLPRGSETKEKKNEQQKKLPPRWIIYVGSLSVLLLTVTFLYSPKRNPSKVVHSKDMASTNSQIDALVTRHMQDAEIQHMMLTHTREMENLQFQNALKEPNQNTIITLPETHGYGVQMDSEDASGKVYEDLADDDPNSKFNDNLPADKIYSRLARRKWLNEQERDEKVAFIRNFIRNAHDQGYDVEINQDLVVTRVNRINPSNEKINIDQVIDRLARQSM